MTRSPPTTRASDDARAHAPPATLKRLEEVPGIPSAATLSKEVAPMDITQVKRVNDQTTIVWTTPNGQHEEHHELTACPDVPKQEFLDAMAGVEADLVTRTGFGTKFGKGFKLIGVAVTPNANGRRQFVPSVKIDFGWGERGTAMSLLLEPDAEGKRTTGTNVLTDAEVKALDHLFECGERYATGERHQAKLALEEDAA